MNRLFSSRFCPDYLQSRPSSQLLSQYCFSIVPSTNLTDRPRQSEHRHSSQKVFEQRILPLSVLRRYHQLLFDPYTDTLHHPMARLSG